MYIDQFAAQFSVQSDVHHLLDYDECVGPDDLGMTKVVPRSRWSLTFTCPGLQPGTSRVLVLSFESGTQTAEHDINAFAELTTAILDARAGAEPFEQYAREYGEVLYSGHGRYSAPLSCTPAALYAAWRRLGELGDRIAAWCGSEEMREALAYIELP